MKRYGLLIGGIAVLTLVVAIAISNASAGTKYQKMQETTKAKTESQYGVTSEAMTSMNDCMNYCASFGGKGKKAAMSDLQRQFSGPINERGSVYTFGYDNYTNIVLDCSTGRCYTRCFQK